ncbi:phage integrase SAM-like domain-containing protein [Parabacteroides merdae]|uniref:phage integrase SAM-like domain-containing protein n=1 Tax=Parabacteroides merdae TaxID=46503 RepID=UPI0032C0F8E9
MTSVKVKFSPSSVILKEGTVHYQIIHHCKVRHIRTGYKLFPSEWISASGEINVSAGSGEGRKSYLAALKNQIDKDLFRIKKCINRLNQEDTPFTVDRIIELYTAPEGNCTFLLYGKELLVELRQIGKVRTAGTYQNALNSFERFRGHRGDIPLDEMDSNQMITYESWLKGTGVCPNTSSYYMRNLRAIYNRAVSEGLVVQRNPFKHVYTGIDKTKKRAVSLSVIRRIRDLDLNKKSLICKYSINSLVYWVTYVHNVVYSFYRSMIYCYINSTQRCAGSIVIDIIPTNGADKRKFFPFAPYFPVTNVIKRYFYPYFPAIIGIKGYSFPYFPYLSGIMKIKTALYSLFSRLDWHKTVVFPCLGEIYEGIRSLSWEIPVT